MRRKLLLLLFVLFAGITISCAEIVSGTCGENLTWNLTDGILTINGTGPMDDYYFTSTPWYSNRSDIETVIINDGITSIGNWAFYSCTMTSITIPNSVISIGESAFKSSGLTSVEIPNSITSIGEQAFFKCHNLVSVSIPNSVTSIGSNVFYDCINLPVVEGVRYADTYLADVDESLQSCTIREGTRWVGSSAFSYCKISSVTIPNSVTYIEDKAFYECRYLTTVTIPNGVISIGQHAFEYCRLTSVTCLKVEPPAMSSGVFGNIDCSQIPLYVPAESVEKYEAAEQWQDFNPILPIGEQSSCLDYIANEQLQTYKVLRNGQILIKRGNKTYTATGQEVK